VYYRKTKEIWNRQPHVKCIFYLDRTRQIFSRLSEDTWNEEDGLVTRLIDRHSWDTLNGV